MTFRHAALFFGLLAGSLAAAGGLKAEEAASGDLNPEEMSLKRSVSKAAEGHVDFVICAQGYLLTKKGDHKDARTIFEECARQGFTGAMTWMSYLDDNGFGAKEDANRASNWDLQAAQKGDPIAQFNYGLDLLRGHGVTADPALGKAYIDKAAAAGIPDARQLQDAGYDYRSVTPDSDEWKYVKPGS
jgi:TPR repeat protein